MYLDATPLIALGSIGELAHLTVFEGPVIVLPTIRSEVTTEPARANLDRFLDRSGVSRASPVNDLDDDSARALLGESSVDGDVRLVAAVLAHTGRDEPVAIVSDDRRIRTVANGLGAEVTGTIGVLVRAVEEGLGETEAKELVRRVDEHGLHMTGELRETAYRLIEEAGE